MDHIVPISELRSQLPEFIKKMRRGRRHLIITKNGKPDAVMITPEELETLEIKADKKLMQSLVRAQEDFKEGRLYSDKDVFGDV